MLFERGFFNLQDGVFSFFLKLYTPSCKKILFRLALKIKPYNNINAQIKKEKNDDNLSNNQIFK